MESLSTFRSEPCKGDSITDLETITNPNTRVSFAPIIMHRRKDLWGPDGKYLQSSTPANSDGLSSADEFDPDRFIDDRVKKYLVPNPFILRRGSQDLPRPTSMIFVQFLVSFNL